MKTASPTWLRAWLERHQHPVSFWLHIVGIPLAVAGVVLAVLQTFSGASTLWWPPLALFVLGYFLQWLGHVLEGNEMGEVVLIKKLLGLPYVAISPRYEPFSRPPTDSASAPCREVHEHVVGDVTSGRNPQTPREEHGCEVSARSKEHQKQRPLEVN